MKNASCTLYKPTHFIIQKFLTKPWESVVATSVPADEIVHLNASAFTGNSIGKLRNAVYIHLKIIFYSSPVTIDSICEGLKPYIPFVILSGRFI